MRLLLALLLLCSPLCVATAPAANRPPDLEQRQVARLLSTCRFVLSQLEGEIKELEGVVEAIMPLESQQREEDLRRLQDWYYGVVDSFRETLADLEEEQVRLREGEPAASRWPQVLDELLEQNREELRELKERAKGFEQEGKRLAGLIDRRNLLLAKSRELEERLARREGKAEQLRSELRVVQNDLLTLPELHEEILRHYRLLAEWAREESELFTLHAARLEALRGLAGIAGRERRRDREKAAAAYQRVIRALEGEAQQVSRLLETLERKRERFIPAGTLREVELGSDLVDLYERFRSRCAELREHLAVLAGELRFELGEATPGRRE